VSPTGYNSPSGGNCLGSGGYGNNVAMGSGAGSCLHFIPVGGTFGSNYLYAVQVAPGGTPTLSSSGGCAGGGSAYGGAASGSADSTASGGIASHNGGSTPFGTGGAGVVAPPGVHTTRGNNGSGIGAGFGGNLGYGGAAYFDGTAWIDANSNGLFGGSQEDGHIIVKFLGPLN
jgi:hypothetical protein